LISSISQTKLRLYSDDTGIDADAFTKTLDRMRREQEGKPVLQGSSVIEIFDNKICSVVKIYHVFVYF
jgi:hypothetical protein